MVYPTKAKSITCSYGVRGSWAAGYHTGIDFAASVGTPIYATKGGRVQAAAMYDIYGSEYGNHIVIELQHNGRTVRALYAHLSRYNVRVGQSVKAGDLIGWSGDTGRTTGPHLHYEERHYNYGYYDHHRPELIYYTPDNRPVISLSKVRPGKNNLHVLRLKKRLNKYFPKRRPLFGKKFNQPLRDRYRGYQKNLGYSDRDADGIPGRVSLEKLGFRVIP